jgi:hypothetical protein
MSNFGMSPLEVFLLKFRDDLSLRALDLALSESMIKSREDALKAVREETFMRRQYLEFRKEVSRGFKESTAREVNESRKEWNERCNLEK